MNNEQILDERVAVVTIFQGSGSLPCQPVKFRRANGREVVITKIGLGYPYEQGSRTIHIFDVTDGQADYRLEFDSVRLIWKLTREALDG